MNGLILGVAATVLGVIVHVALLRAAAPLASPLLPVFLLIAAVLLGLAVRCRAVPGVEDWAVTHPGAQPGSWLRAAAERILYDSPTPLVNEIEAHGTDGMPVAAFESFVASSFVRSRLQALVAAGELSERDGRC